MTAKFVAYDEATGRIRRTGTTNASLADTTYAPYIIELIASDPPDANDTYVDVNTGEFMARPPNPTTISSPLVNLANNEVASLANVPTSAAVRVKGAYSTEAYAAQDGAIDLQFTTPGVYTVTVDAFPEVSLEFEVTVV